MPVSLRRRRDRLGQGGDRIASLVEEAEAPACALDAHGLVIAANQQLGDLLGTSREGLADRSLSAISDAFGVSFQQSVLGPMFAGHRDRHQLTARCVRGDTGEEVWATWDLSLVRDNRGEPRAAVAFVANHTADVHAGTHVRILQRMITASGEAADGYELLDAATRVICHYTGCGMGQVWVPDGDTLSCSRIYYTHGYGVDELRRASLGLRYRRGEGLPGAAWATEREVLVVDLDGGAAFDRDHAAYRAGARKAIAAPVRTAAGVAAVLELFVTSDRRVADRQGLVAKVCAELGELLERRELSDALRSSEERFRGLAGAAVDALISADGSGRVLTWNRAAERMFGRSAEEMEGQPLAAIIPERFRAAHEAGIARVAATGRSQLAGSVVELAGLRRDGREFPMELSIGLWENEEGTAFAGVIRDISERKNAEAALAQAAREVERTNAELETLIYAASHDLKSPMISVLGYLDYLREDYGPVLGPEGARYLDRMTDCTLYMQRLIGDLIELSRAGRTTAQAVDVDLRQLTRTIVDELGSAHPDVAFHVGDLPVVTADPLAFRQLLTNLIGNAVQHGARSDLAVAISSRVLADGSVELSVRDNGQGIPLAYRERVFGIFERLDAPSSSERAGTGMGLAICRKIIEQLGGTISIVGVAGTDVRVLVPAPLVRAVRPAGENGGGNPGGPRGGATDGSGAGAGNGAPGGNAAPTTNSATNGGRSSAGDGRASETAVTA
jgi:PAS domain S-box-containing protein